MENKGKLLIKNIKSIISCDDQDSVYNNSYLYAENGIIKDINTMDKLNPFYLQSETIIDALNCIIYPGLINAHHHLYQTMSRNLPQIQNQNYSNGLIIYLINGKT